MDTWIERGAILATQYPPSRDNINVIEWCASNTCQKETELKGERGVGFNPGCKLPEA